MGDQEPMVVFRMDIIDVGDSCMAGLPDCWWDVDRMNGWIGPDSLGFDG